MSLISAVTFCRAENSEGLSQVENLRDRRRLFQAPPTQRLRQTRHSCMEFGASIGSPHGNDFRFSFSSRMLHPQIETSPTKGISDPPFLIRREHNKRNALCLNRSELGNTELPNAQEL